MKKAKAAQDFLHRAVNLVLPPRCIVSGVNVDIQGLVAPEAWRQFDFISAPFCRCCGCPFPFSAIPDAVCATCLRDPPPYNSARAVLFYNDLSRDLILRFKHGDQIHTTGTLAAWMHRTAGPLMDIAELLVPVPLHRGRLLKRRYNQAALLAQRLGQLSGLPCMPDILKRKRSTPSQGHMDYKARYRNVKHAFAINPRYGEQLNGKTIILIDDVYTSGATVRECTKVLRAGGAGAIHVLTLARVVRAESGAGL